MENTKVNNLLVYGLTGLFVVSFVAIAITGLVSIAFFLISPFAFADSIANNEQATAQCLACHGKPGFSINRNGEKINLYVDRAKYSSSIHGTNSCASCHNNLGGIPHKKAVYGKQLAQQVHERCQACHDNVAKIYRNSVHGQKAQLGQDTALCQDCHGTHQIQRKQDASSQAYWQNVPKTCTKCHSGNAKEAYNYSFHGIAVRNGYDKSPNCTDCHGAHEILGPENAKSLVNKQNVPKTCAKCHAKAAPGFANGFEHRVPQDKTNAFSMWVLYKIFIGLIIFDVTMSGSIVLWELSRKYRATADHQQHHVPQGPSSSSLKH